MRDSNSKNLELSVQMSSLEEEVRQFQLKLDYGEAQIKELRNTNNLLGKEKEQRNREIDEMTVEREKTMVTLRQKEDVIRSFQKSFDEQISVCKNLEG